MRIIEFIGQTIKATSIAFKTEVYLFVLYPESVLYFFYFQIWNLIAAIWSSEPKQLPVLFVVLSILTSLCNWHPDVYRKFSFFPGIIFIFVLHVTKSNLSRNPFITNKGFLGNPNPSTFHWDMFLETYRPKIFSNFEELIR